MRLTVRPITLWPGKLRADRERITGPFDVTWNKCTADLQREVEYLSSREAFCVVEMACTEKDIRLDGWLYADAKLGHPGVILHVESKVGPLKLWTDRFRHWNDNVRAVSLYLSHQRAAERYGLGRGDEAFQGWKAIGASSIELGPATLTYEMAINLIATCSGSEPTTVENYPNASFRKAASLYHPDNKDTGDAEKYMQLVAARDLIFKTQGGGK